MEDHRNAMDFSMEQHLEEVSQLHCSSVTSTKLFATPSPHSQDRSPLKTLNSNSNPSILGSSALDCLHSLHAHTDPKRTTIKKVSLSV